MLPFIAPAELNICSHVYDSYRKHGENGQNVFLWRAFFLQKSTPQNLVRELVIKK
jgi:hypothetical protein